MSLEQVLSAIDRSIRALREVGYAEQAYELAEARAPVSAALTQPAQAVDDEMIDRARNRYRFVCGLNDECEDDTLAWKEAIAAALTGKQP